MKGDEMNRLCGTYARDEKCIQNYGRKTEREMSFRRPRRRWYDNIRMDLRRNRFGGCGLD